MEGTRRGFPGSADRLSQSGCGSHSCVHFMSSQEAGHLRYVVFSVFKKILKIWLATWHCLL